MSVIRYEEPGLLAGELLPERTVLGVISTPFNNAGGAGDGGSSSSSAAASGGNVVSPDHGATAISACQSTQWQQPSGLLSDLALGSQNPSANLACTPAAIASH